MGRPTTYSQPIADRICDELAHGKSLRRICDADDMPGDSSVYRWLELHEAFREQYARARELQAEYYAAEIIEIADDSTNDYMTITKKNGDDFEVLNKEAVMRSSLRVDARKWYASKVAPKKYGEMRQIEHTGKVTLESLICGDSVD